MNTLLHISEADLIKVGLAVLCGGLLGLERQYKNKIAGFRTIILICLGSTLFTIVAQTSGNLAAMNIVTGVGFIGAGVIFKDNAGISGLTTAAVIWVSAGIGMVIGSEHYLLGVVSTIVVLMVLVTFSLLEDYIDKIHRDKLFVIEFTSGDFENLEHIRELITANGLKFNTVNISKKDGCLQAAIWVTGRKMDLSKLAETLLKMPEIRSF
ncbi:MgtC/SapB family protein [Mucilaginibacter sp.]|uniref:MgtC/SapB family protein n=1 Tax=Mucilaginibacter sp. TaxID=1882438 RepID=UPI00283FC890|nr:MgtC/SapB family protein [Mucilaginibacter sp.]MDR3694963.1 MgtC/SapB family protein [Mucilaginibacter sp.]